MPCSSRWQLCLRVSGSTISQLGNGAEPADYESGGQRPFRKSLSGVQLVEQGLGLLQIERVETLGEPT